MFGLAAFVGCGGSSSGGGGTNATPVAKENFAGELAKALCTNIGPCCQQAGYTHDAAKCTALLEGVYKNMVAGAVQYDAQKGGECVAYAASIVKNCGAEPAEGPCDGVVAGTIPEGGKCQTSAECIVPPKGDADCDNGVCVQVPRGKAGDGCSGTCTESGSTTTCGGGGTSGGNALCFTNDGLACGADGKCAALAKVGETCTGDDCVAAAYCDYSSEKCVTRAAIGGACQDSQQCAAGAHCAADKCAAAKPDGAACVDWDECASGDCEAGKCGPQGLASPQLCSGSTSK